MKSLVSVSMFALLLILPACSPAPQPKGEAAAQAGAAVAKSTSPSVATPAAMPPPPILESSPPALRALQAEFECTMDADGEPPAYLYENLIKATRPLDGPKPPKISPMDVDEDTPTPTWRVPDGLRLFGLEPVSLWAASGFDGQSGLSATFKAPKAEVSQAIKRRWPNAKLSEYGLYISDDIYPITVSTEASGETKVLCGG